MEALVSMSCSNYCNVGPQILKFTSLLMSGKGVGKLIDSTTHDFKNDMKEKLNKL